MLAISMPRFWDHVVKMMCFSSGGSGWVLFITLVDSTVDVFS